MLVLRHRGADRHRDWIAKCHDKMRIGEPGQMLARKVTAQHRDLEAPYPVCSVPLAYDPTKRCGISGMQDPIELFVFVNDVIGLVANEDTGSLKHGSHQAGT